MGKEAEAINCYEQRMAIEPDDDAKAIMAGAQQEEFKHFAMDVEYLIRQKPKWRVALQGVLFLFKEGDIVQLDEQAEQAEDKA